MSSFFFAKHGTTNQKTAQHPEQPCSYADANWPWTVHSSFAVQQHVTGCFAAVAVAACCSMRIMPFTINNTILQSTSTRAIWIFDLHFGVRIVLCASCEGFSLSLTASAKVENHDQTTSIWRFCNISTKGPQTTPTCN
jgi:hypothetical protein